MKRSLNYILFSLSTFIFMMFTIFVGINSVYAQGEQISKSQQVYASTAPDVNFDWSKLNSDGLNLSEYTEVDKNTPVKLEGGAFDTQQRNYYLYFGHSTSKIIFDNSTGKFESKGDMYKKLVNNNGVNGRVSILSPSMIGSKKSDGKVALFGYEFNQDTPASIPGVGFDIGETDDSGAVKSASITGLYNTSAIVKQYVKKMKR